MRLKEYLNEEHSLDENDYEEIITSIEKDCQPFLKQMNASNFSNENLLYTGKKACVINL